MMRFCIHKYSRWSKVLDSYGGSLHQVCACEKCGAVLRRKAIGILWAQLRGMDVNEALKEHLK